MAGDNNGWLKGMRYGRVYVWTPDPASTLGGRVTKSIVPLLHLNANGQGGDRLWGCYVRVRNGGWVNEPDETGAVRGVPLGEARPNADDDFLFEPGRGGGRLDKVLLAASDMRRRYIHASHFGEVNTYFHLDRIAAYVDELLHELNAPNLPTVTAVVNAHHAATEIDGIRDGVRRGECWLPFQGGHYRLPSQRYDIPEYEPISVDGEIHLGPGWQLLQHGALVEVAGGRYRSNASHNAGIIYHEYGHHITRHTADFRANVQRPPNKQNNRKTSLDEGFSDYWAATMLGTPHIWAWHRRHDDHEIHARSLSSPMTMADYDHSPGADPHANGTIWAAALWELRERLSSMKPDGVRRTDLLVLKTLILLGQLVGHGERVTVRNACRARESYVIGLTALLEADKLLYSTIHHDSILRSFSKRGIQPDLGVKTDIDRKPCLKAASPQGPSASLPTSDK